MYVLETKQVSVVDRYLCDHGYTIMELISMAGNAFYKHVRKYQKPLILAGFGNNGADALMVAQLFKQDGIQADIYSYLKEKMNPNCIALSKGLHFIDSIDTTRYDVIIDGVFGAGLDRAIKDDLASIFDIVNQADLPRYSIDIPSGINGDGIIYDHYFHADHVITFMGLKKLYLIKEYQKYYHHVVLEDLGMKDELFIKNRVAQLIDEDYVIHHLKHRHFNDYKNKNGVILHVTGCNQYVGASMLAAKGSVYSGTGILKVCSSENVLRTLNMTLPEAVAISESELSTDHDAILIGCGLSQSDEAFKKLEYILTQSDVPVVVDADGINLLAKHMDLLEKVHCPLVFTPHLGELKRLVPDGNYQNFVEKHNCILIIKGPQTKIMSKDYCFMNSTGNKAMAIGGSGDTLAGIIVSMIGQGYDLMVACNLAVYFHGKAGDTIAQNSYVALPSDLAKQVSIEMKKVEDLKYE